MGKTKRIFAGADPHCGHKVGLTPPGWWTTQEPDWARVQKAMWKWFEAEINKLKPFDMAFWNADMIDGRGERSGGTELITPDRLKQTEIAIQVVNSVGAETNCFTYGTPYHVGTEEDYEYLIAKAVNGKIGGHLFIDVNGTVFDIKHKVGGSQIPHGRHTPIAKERLWNLLWEEQGAAYKASIFLRAHNHYFSFCGNDQFLAINMPALQGFGSKFGVRQCSGVVNFGFTVFSVRDDGSFTWEAKTTVLKVFKPTLHKF